MDPPTEQLQALARFRAFLTPDKIVEINQAMMNDPNLLARAAELVGGRARPSESATTVETVES